MTNTWLFLKNQVIRLLQDTDRTAAQYSDDDLLDGINSALIDIVSHTARKKTIEVVLEEPTTQLETPSDWLAPGPIAIQVQGLYWQMWTPYAYRPDETLPTPYSFSLSNNSYYEWPKGTLNFLWLVPANIKLRLQYYAYWDEMVDDAGLFTFRHRWMLDALKWNTTSKVLLKSVVQSAGLRQWNIKVDSGEPEDNPMLKASQVFYRMYQDKLAEYPPQDRSVWDSGD